MVAVGPFEGRPRLAVAVSGGADSLALALLADRWARLRSGRIVALTVDHGLRKDSAAEARQVGRWLAKRGIDHSVLRWTGAKPTTGIQAAARQARYRLLTDWCAQEGVLHLLLAHHAGDQMETFLLRVAGRSGVDGLAGMAAVVEDSSCRLVRPLLAVPRPRLEATLRAADQEWIEDPSNQNSDFARVRVRTLLSKLEGVGKGLTSLSGTVRAAGRVRAAFEAPTWALLARAAELSPDGYARLRLAPLRVAPRPIAERAVQRLLLCVGGNDYPPRRERLGRLLDELLAKRAAKARTLAGCRIIPSGDSLLVCPELRTEPAKVSVAVNRMVRWADRFEVAFGSGHAKGRVWIAPLGDPGWADALKRQPEVRDTRVPYPVRAGLPALFDRGGLQAVPQLGFRRKSSTFRDVVVHFRPRHSLSGPGFLLAPGRSGTI